MPILDKMNDLYARRLTKRVNETIDNSFSGYYLEDSIRKEVEKCLYFMAQETSGSVPFNILLKASPTIHTEVFAEHLVQAVCAVSENHHSFAYVTEEKLLKQRNLLSFIYGKDGLVVTDCTIVDSVGWERLSAWMEGIPSVMKIVIVNDDDAKERIHQSE